MTEQHRLEHCSFSDLRQFITDSIERNLTNQPGEKNDVPNPDIEKMKELIKTMTQVEDRMELREQRMKNIESRILEREDLDLRQYKKPKFEDPFPENPFCSRLEVRSNEMGELRDTVRYQGEAMIKFRETLLQNEKDCATMKQEFEKMKDQHREIREENRIDKIDRNKLRDKLFLAEPVSPNDFNGMVMIRERTEMMEKKVNKLESKEWTREQKYERVMHRLQENFDQQKEELQKDMQKEIKQIHTSLEHMRPVLDKEMEKIREDLQKQLSEGVYVRECGICFKTKTMYSQHCGHLCCEECWATRKKSNETEYDCPFCRAKNSTIPHKIYL